MNSYNSESEQNSYFSDDGYVSRRELRKTNKKRRRRRKRSPIIPILLALILAAAAYFSVTCYIGYSALKNAGILDTAYIHSELFIDFSPSGSGEYSDISSSGISSEPVAVISGVTVYDGAAIKNAENSSPAFFKKLSLFYNCGLDVFSAKKSGISLYRIKEAAIKSTSAEASEPIDDYITPPTIDQLSVPGIYVLKAGTGGKSSSVILNVRDTSAPLVTLKNIELWQGDKCDAYMFIDSVVDASAVTASFVKAPDTGVIGEQTVSVKVCDIFGNASEISEAALTVSVDRTPPVIDGAANRTVTVGSAISYKQGIAATDDRDMPEDITLIVDSSAVDPNTPGEYKVTYTAIDRAGNKSDVTVTFTVAEENADPNAEALELQNYVTNIASSIFKDGMSDGQKVSAIYDWCRNHIAYSGSSEKDGYVSAAIRGFSSRSGDCYTYFACSKALFEYCGIENKDVIKQRIDPSESRHYWSMVNVGSGWYHFDATPRKGGFDGFMLTDAELDEYSLAHGETHRRNTADYPATPETPF